MIKGVCGQAQLWQTSLGDATYWQHQPSSPQGNCHFSTRSASFRQVAAISSSIAFDWGSGAQAAMASHSAARERYHSTLGTTNSRTIPARNLPNWTNAVIEI
jgi:hypothetical protein